MRITINNEVGNSIVLSVSRSTMCCCYSCCWTHKFHEYVREDRAFWVRHNTVQGRQITLIIVLWISISHKREAVQLILFPLLCSYLSQFIQLMRFKLRLMLMLLFQHTFASHLIIFICNALVSALKIWFHILVFS